MKWARERAKLSLDIAAMKIGRDPSVIEAWENGSMLPTISQARKAAEVYKRSLSVFYLPEPPTDFDTLPDFRKNEYKEYSPELALLIRQIQVKVEWLHEYLKEEGVRELSFIGKTDYKAVPHLVANDIRSTLGVTREAQKRCRDNSAALKLWIDAAESVGINIIRKGGIQSSEVRGLLITDKYAPFIFLNSNDSNAGRQFTLLHELAHLWINQPGLSDPFGNFRRNVTIEDQIEIFCNQVANCILVDIKDVLSQWNTLKSSYSFEKCISLIAKTYSVSEEVIARNLLDEEQIEQYEYNIIRGNCIRNWELHKEKQKDQSGYQPHSQRMSQENGYRYSKLVVDAYSRGKISGRDASTLLHVKVNNFQHMYKYLF